MRWLAAILLVPTLAWSQAYEVIPLAPGLLPAAPSLGTPLNLGDDNTARVTLPFTFTYFDQPFTRAWVSSNGFLSFSTNSNLCCDASNIQNAPRNTIFGLWADLVSYSGNPFVQTLTTTSGLSQYVVGWYGTKEYGTNNSSTFQIALNSDNTFEIHYGAVSTQYHTFLAGFTGPTYADNSINLYGQVMNSLSYESYMATLPKEALDCAKTPSDPACALTPVVSPTTVVTAVQEAAVEQSSGPVQISVDNLVAATPVEAPVAVAEAVTAAVTVQTAQPVERAVAQETQAVQVAEAPVLVERAATPAAKEEAAAQKAEVLSPSQLAALVPAVDMNGGSSNGSEGTTSLSGGGAAAFAAMASGGPDSASNMTSLSFNAVMSSATSAVSPTNLTSATAMQNSANSPTGQTQQATLDAVAPAAQSRTEVAAATSAQMASTQAGTLGGDQGATMAAMAAVPGFAQYAQAALPDRPGFYPPTQPYRNNRPVDAYLMLYRMTMTSDRTYTAMTEAQYGR